jgi:circadian clock protein KaiB
VSAPDDYVPPDAGDLPASGERAVPAPERYVLRLYVTGMTPRSCQAIRNLQTICDERLAGRYDLDVIDIYQQPVLTRGEQIIAAPTLIKKLPLPMRRLVGDMADRERVLLGLDLVAVPIPRKVGR